MTQFSDFIVKFLAPAQASHAKFYPRGPFVSISLAQTIIESNWGKISSGDNNYWGIKANAEQIKNGQCAVRWTHETINGVYQKMPQTFANYPDLQSGFDAHAHLLTSPWYQRCIDAATPRDYAHALWLCHYATGIPGHPYDQALIGIMDSNNLYQYDKTYPEPAVALATPTKPAPGWYWAKLKSGGNWVVTEVEDAYTALTSNAGRVSLTNITLGPAITKPADLT